MNQLTPPTHLALQPPQTLSLGSSSDDHNNNFSMPSTPTSPTSPNNQTTTNMRLLNPASLATTISNETGLSEDAITLALVSQNGSPPSNLLVIFLEACSASLQELKMDNTTMYDKIKLFMLILACISEDQYANSILHDNNVFYSVFLYQAVKTFSFSHS
jgi:hypothetical protein